MKNQSTQVRRSASALPAVEDIWYYWLYMRPQATKTNSANALLAAVKSYARMAGRLVYGQAKKQAKQPVAFDFNAKLIIAAKSINHFTVFDAFSDWIRSPASLLYPRPENPQCAPAFGSEKVGRMLMLRVVVYILWKDITSRNLDFGEATRYRLFDDYIRYLQISQFLGRCTANAVVLFNDHMPQFRALKFAAEAMGLDTIYLPHASVNSRFPPLTFSYSLLEGEDMRDKYLQAGKSLSKIVLIGNLKIARYRNLAASGTQRSGSRQIGIAYNSLDSISEIKKLVDELLSLFKSTAEFRDAVIVIRPHPADRRDLPANGGHVKYSDPIRVVSFDFLSEVDLCVAGNSNIALESLLLGTPVVHFSAKSDSSEDNYGFVQNGIVESPCTNAEATFRKIIKSAKSGFKIPRSVQLKLGRYDEGHTCSSDTQIPLHAAKIIDRIVMGND